MDRSRADDSAPQRRGADRQLGMMSSLQEARKEGYVPFTFGPLYVYGKVPFDIVARFCAETTIEAFTGHFDFPFAIIALPRPYNKRLFVMDDTAYPHFCKYMETVQLAHREEGDFMVPLRMGGALMDPFMRALETQEPTPEAIDVWSVSGMRAIIRPTTFIEELPYPVFREGEAEELTRDEFRKRLPRPTKAPKRITMEKIAPDPKVIAQGRATLGQL